MMRRAAFFVALALVLSACADNTLSTGDDGASDSQSGATSPRGRPVAQAVSSPSEDVPSALDAPNHDSFPAPLIDPDEIISGGPPPDGIPSIDDPKFLPPGEVDFLDDNEPVLALEVDGDARAYPVQILIWHEIVNDTVGEVPSR